MINRKSKILFILHFPPPVHGSSVVGKQIFNSKKINENFSNVFINLSTSTQVDKIGEISIDKFVFFIKILFKIFKTLLFSRIDKVYLAPTVSKKGLYKDYLLILILKIFRAKKFYHLHNKGVSKRKKSTFLDFLYSSFFKNAKVVLLSEKLYKDVEEFVDIKNVFICPNGIKDGVVSINRKQNKKKERLNLLFLSNLITSKGVYVLLDACKELLNKKVEYTCNFVGGEGDISKEQFSQKVKELNLENNVFYLGKKYNEEKKEIFLNSDIFILPTFYHNECFPLVCLEAMMYGLPVISTSEGAISDIIEDNKTGFVVQKKNYKELADKISEILNDDEKRKAMGENSRSRFEEKFTLEIFEEKMVTILEN